MVINPIKTRSTTIATRQKHQLSLLPLDLVLNGAKMYLMSEHHLLGITTHNRRRWDSHINNVCKPVSRRVFLEIPSMEIKVYRRYRHQKTVLQCPILNLILIMRQSCGTDVVMSSKRDRLNSLHRRALKLIFPDTTLTTDQTLKEMRIMSLQKQHE